MNDTKIKSYLKEHEIEFIVHKHPTVFTVEEANKYLNDVSFLHCKNLFLKERKSRAYFLYIMPANKRLDMEKLSQLVENKIKFASEQDLKEKLDIYSGAVSVFSLINNKEEDVIALIDKEVWKADKVGFHPNINTETLELSGKDFKKFVESLKCEFKVL